MPDTARELDSHPSATARAVRPRWRLVIGVAAALVALAASAVAARAFRAEAMMFWGQAHAVPRPTASEAPAQLEDASFRTPDGLTIRGWYAPSRNRAAVILTHGTTSDRRDTLPEARLLAEAGFGVLLFDFPGHGESEGKVSWGEPDRAALRAAIDFVSRRAEVDPARIGLAGFSMGGVVVTQVAAADDRPRAILLAGTPSDLAAQTRWEYRRYRWLSTLPALLALRLHGLDVDAQRPVDLVSKLAPRPLLILAGELDGVVPPWMARDLFRAAGDNKQLYTLPNAGHGGYLQVEPQTYPARLVSFFRENLDVR